MLFSFGFCIIKKLSVRQADMAQSVEQLIRNQQVASSNLAISSIKSPRDFQMDFSGDFFYFSAA